MLSTWTRRASTRPNSHIQLIALGGTIGTGLFLGEMLVEEPNAGSFSYFANRYLGRFAGFLAGWNCVALYVLEGRLELTAAGKFIQFWWPAIPTWVTAAVFFLLNYVAPAGVLELLMSLIVAALVITWTIIIVAHWRFRRAHVARGIALGFAAPQPPLGAARTPV